jgi:hypothetical protein
LTQIEEIKESVQSINLLIVIFLWKDELMMHSMVLDALMGGAV